MSKTVHLSLPVTEDQVRDLDIGDIVFLSGKVFTCRDQGHRRMLEYFKNGNSFPIDFSQYAMWHCGPIVDKDENGDWKLIVAGSTTSSRFSDKEPAVLKNTGLRVIIGKGIMYEGVVRAMQEKGAVMLNATGGCAALYGEAVTRIADVFWMDLGLPEAMWCFDISEMGPLIVGIDAKGNSIIQNTRSNSEAEFERAYAQMGLDPGHYYIIHPEHIIGTPWE